ncbi:MAG TPA: EAL domain-containing protein [Rhodocyclaceae bacterium]|nr:EAL domain-containing protein [Rhodocyclaceae bacterium]
MTRNNGSFGFRAAAALVVVTLLLLLGWLTFTYYQYRSVVILFGDDHAETALPPGPLLQAATPPPEPEEASGEDDVNVPVATGDTPVLARWQRRFLAQAAVGGVGIVVLGAVLGLLLIIANKRKQDEARAKALNTQLTSLIETIPDPVHFKDADGRWLIVNQAGLRLCDLESAPWQGKTDLELAELRPAYREIFAHARERDEEAIRSGTLAVYDDEIVREGERRLFEVRKLAHMEDGRAVSLLALRRDVTEERAAKAALVASERRYRDVVDNIREVIFRIDAKGILTFLNPAWETLTAWTVESALGTRSLDYVHPDDRERSRTLIRPLMKGRQDCFREVVRYLRADGGWRWVEVFAAPAVDAQGQRCGAYGTLMDVTEQRRMLDALRAERDLFAAGPVMVFVWRNEAGWPVEYVSANVHKELGYEPEHMTAESFRYAQLIHPDDLARIEREVQRFVGGQCASFELSYRLRDGHGRYRWFREWSVPQWGEGGDFVELRGYVIDETDTKEAQLAAEAARQRQLWILEGANVGTWEWDVQGGELAINTRWAQMLGYTVADLSPLTAEAWQRMMHPDDRDACHDRMLAHFAGESPYYEGEHRLRHKNGSWLWVLARGRVIERLPDGEPALMCGTLMDIAQRKEAEAHAAHLAYFDELTGLPNRRMLLERLRHVQAASKRAHIFSALLFIDLDNFKNLNDTLGHDYGDMLLREVALRLGDILREDDTVARLGGDEFVVLLEELDAREDEAVVKAERAVLKILAALSSPYQLDEHRHHLTPSIGVTLFRDAGDSVETLMKKADLAMYQAKAAGRGTFRFFDPAMQATAERRMHLEIELRQALEQGQFVLAYQPIVDAAGTVTAAEALLRWQHPQHGLVSPGEFIPVAEASGLIVPLGRWVLRCACEQLARWRDCATRGAWRMAVNVSARQFHQPDFVTLVLESLQQAGADPCRLRLEITESMLLENIDETIARMIELRTHGVSFALDDFGTGYSSLNYLKKLPLSVLKIDQSFVRDIGSDPNDATIVQTIIAMAHSLELKVVAEGVESAEQKAFLLAHACDALQGYFFHRPMPIELLDRLAGAGRKVAAGAIDG